MFKLMSIAAGGAIGVVLRYIVSGSFYRYVNVIVFPWGTVAVNLIGSFIIGFLWVLFDQTNVSGDLKAFALIGVIGSFTTFSTFTLESMHLIRDGNMRFALYNILLSNFFGILLVIVGFKCSKYVLKLWG